MLIKTLIKNLSLATIVFAVIYSNLVFIPSAWFGWLFLFLFLSWSSKIIHNLLIKFFVFSRSLRIRILSIFLVLAILGFVAGALSWIFKMTPLILSSSFFIIIFCLLNLKKITNQDDGLMPEIQDEQKQVFEEGPSSKVGLVLYLVLVAIAFYFLATSQTSANIFSPWQVISPSYIYIFFAATLVLGFLIFSKLKSGTILFLLILNALLLHAYLPLSHTLFYGADGWRHIAIQNTMLIDGVDKTLAFDISPTSVWQRLNFGSLAYAQFNSLSLIFKMIGQVDQIVFLRYFIPIVWSIILPILLFEIARVIGWEKKRALWLVWFAAFPFALQVSGSYSLPSNFSLLFFLLLLLLQFKNHLKPSRIGQIVILLLGGLSVFGHSLYFILFVLSYVLIYLLDSNQPSDRIKKIKILGATIFSIGLIPTIELVSHFSELNLQLNWWGQIKAVLGSLSAWYVANGLRTSDITIGNIFFNQPPINTLVLNIFTINRFWICAFMLVFWMVFFIGSYQLYKKQKNNLGLIWTTLTIGLLSSYIISRYFLIGENILTRRLDAILAILIVLPSAYFLYELIIKIKNIFYQRVFLCIIILFCSLGVAASYSLGPDTSVSSLSQYQAVEFIWQKSSANFLSACVVSDTDTLLILEAISGKKIVGGGFPMNLYFAQPELKQLLMIAKTDPQQAIVQAKKVLKSDSCFLVGEYNLQHPVAQFDNIKIYNN